MLLAVGYVTKSPLQAYPAAYFLTWAALTPVALIIATLGMQELMRRFLMNAVMSVAPSSPATTAAAWNSRGA